MITVMGMRIDEYAQAIKNKDSALLQNFYTTNACMVPPGEKLTCKGNFFISNNSHI